MIRSSLIQVLVGVLFFHYLFFSLLCHHSIPVNAIIAIEIDCNLYTLYFNSVELSTNTPISPPFYSGIGPDIFTPLSGDFNGFPITFANATAIIVPTPLTGNAVFISFSGGLNSLIPPNYTPGYYPTVTLTVNDQTIVSSLHTQGQTLSYEVTNLLANNSNLVILTFNNMATFNNNPLTCSLTYAFNLVTQAQSGVIVGNLGSDILLIYPWLTLVYAPNQLIPPTACAFSSVSPYAQELTWGLQFSSLVFRFSNPTIAQIIATIFHIPVSSVCVMNTTSSGRRLLQLGATGGSGGGSVTIFLINNLNNTLPPTNITVAINNTLTNLTGSSLTGNVTVGSAPLPQGAVSGDPHFVGWLGQQFQFHGVPGNVYSIISHPDFQLNTRIQFLDENQLISSCPLKTVIRTTCFAHPGTYLSEIGIMSGDGTILHLEAGNANEGFKSVYLKRNHEEEEDLLENLGNEKNSCDISQKLNEIISRNSFELEVELICSHRIIVTFGLFHLGIDNSANFFNLLFLSKPDTHKSFIRQSHGLLGQTWQRKTYLGINNKLSVIEGEPDDYVIEGGLLGSKFAFSRFAHEIVTEEEVGEGLEEEENKGALLYR